MGMTLQVSSLELRALSGSRFLILSQALWV